MKSFVEQARMYKSYHTKPITIYTHYIGIPLVLLSLIMFFGCIKVIIPGIFATDLGWILSGVLLFYYFVLEWRLALVCLPFFLLLLYIAYLFNYAGPSSTAMIAFIVCFVLGWGFQLLGHFFEGNRPALMDNFTQAFIAPLYIVAELAFQLGFFSDIETKLE